MKRRENVFLSRLKELDLVLIFASLALTVYGVICVSSATEIYGTNKFVLVQILAAVIGIVAMLVMALIDYDELLQRFFWPIAGVSLFLLLLPVIKSIPDMLRGNFESNNNWINVPVLNVKLQPTEVVKALFVMLFGYILGKNKDRINSIRGLIPVLSAAVVILVFVMLQKDLGAAIVYFVVICAMIYIAGLSHWYFVGAGVCAVLASPFLWRFLSEYQKMRILVGFDPTLDPEGYGYQVIQTLKAISSGGLFGMGYGNGTLTHNPSESMFPARETDVILGVIGEEFGFVGILVYLVLISVVVVRIMQVAKKARKDYGAFICVGIATIIIFQTVENVGMCLGMLPVIGLTLPFISYGGSSIVSLYLCLGAVMSIRTHKQKYYFEREKR